MDRIKNYSAKNKYIIMIFDKTQNQTTKNVYVQLWKTI